MKDIEMPIPKFVSDLIEYEKAPTNRRYDYWDRAHNRNKKRNDAISFMIKKWNDLNCNSYERDVNTIYKGLDFREDSVDKTEYVLHCIKDKKIIRKQSVFVFDNILYTWRGLVLMKMRDAFLKTDFDTIVVMHNNIKCFALYSKYEWYFCNHFDKNLIGFEDNLNAENRMTVTKGHAIKIGFLNVYEFFKSWDGINIEYTKRWFDIPIDFNIFQNIDLYNFEIIHLWEYVKKYKTPRNMLNDFDELALLFFYHYFSHGTKENLRDVQYIFSATKEIKKPYFGLASNGYGCGYENTFMKNKFENSALGDVLKFMMTLL